MRSIKVFSLVLWALFILSCNKEAEVVQNAITLADLGLIDEYDSFSVNALKDTLLVTNNGFGVFITGNSFVDEQGHSVDGKIDLKVKDVVRLSEIFAENISTLCPRGMLETRGMLEIKAYLGGKPIELRHGKAIDLFFPGDSIDYREAEIYYGYEDIDRTIKWTKGSKQDLRNDPIDWGEEMLLGFYINTDMDYPDVVENMSFFQQDNGMIDSLRNWLGLSKLEKKIIYNNPVSIRWILFGDGDFEVYDIEGDIPDQLKNKIERKLNNIPSVAAFHREGGAAQVNGSMTIMTHLIENEILDNFSLRSYQLGWINCDIFIRNNVPLINMVVDAPNPNVLMRLIFDDYKTIVSGVLKDDGRVYFEGIADGASVRLITMYPEGVNAQVSISRTVVHEKISTPTNFIKVGKRELEKILDDMIE